MLISALPNIVTLPYAEPVWIYSKPSHPFLFRIHFNIILPSAHAVYKEFLRFLFCGWTLHMFLTSSVPSTCPVCW
jgi:hypothetical protein